MDFYNYKVLKIEKVVDGDTIYLTADLGFKVHFFVELRLLDVDTPELRDKNPRIKEFAYHMKDFVKELFQQNQQADYILRSKKRGKYGRWLGDLTINDVSLVKVIKDEMDRYKVEKKITWKGRN